MTTILNNQSPVYILVGVQGISGPPGTPGMIWEGPWDSSTTYQINDVVQYNGSSYIAIAINTDDAPPSANWNLVAQAGGGGGGGVTSLNTQTGAVILESNSLGITNVSSGHIDIELTSSPTEIFFADASTGLAVTSSSFTYDTVGEIFNVGFDNTNLSLNGSTGALEYNSNDPWMILDGINRRFQIGDLTNDFFGTFIDINDDSAARNITLHGSNGVIVSNLAGSGNGYATLDNIGALGFTATIPSTSITGPLGLVPYFDDTTGQMITDGGFNRTASNFNSTYISSGDGINNIQFLQLNPAGNYFLWQNINTGYNSGMYATQSDLTIYNGVGLHWPSADGTAGQVMQTDGSGVLSFDNVSAGAVSGTATQIPYFDAITGLMTSDANHTIDNSNNGNTTLRALDNSTGNNTLFALGSVGGILQNIVWSGYGAPVQINWGDGFINMQASNIYQNAYSGISPYWDGTNLQLKLFNNNVDWFWPSTDGSNGQVMQTDGAGLLSFGNVTPASISGDAPRIPYYDGTTGLMTDDADFTRDNTNNYATFIQTGGGTAQSGLNLSSDNGSSTYLSYLDTGIGLTSGVTLDSTQNTNSITDGTSTTLVTLAPQTGFFGSPVDAAGFYYYGDMSSGNTGAETGVIVDRSSGGAKYILGGLSQPSYLLLDQGGDNFNMLVSDGGSFFDTMSFGSLGMNIAYANNTGGVSSLQLDSGENTNSITDNATYTASNSLNSTQNISEYTDSLDGIYSQTILSQGSWEAVVNDGGTSFSNDITMNSSGIATTFTDITTGSSQSITMSDAAIINSINNPAFSGSITTTAESSTGVGTGYLMNVVDGANAFTYNFSMGFNGTGGQGNNAYLGFQDDGSLLQSFIQLGEPLTIGTNDSLGPNTFTALTTMDASGIVSWFTDILNGITGAITIGDSYSVVYDDATSIQALSFNYNDAVGNQSRSILSSVLAQSEVTDNTTYDALNVTTNAQIMSQYFDITDNIKSSVTLDNTQNTGEFTDSSTYDVFNTLTSAFNKAEFHDLGTGIMTRMTLNNAASSLTTTDSANSQFAVISGTVGSFGGVRANYEDDVAHTFSGVDFTNAISDFFFENSTTTARTGLTAVDGITTIGTYSGGSGTTITIDDLMSLITMANVPQYANDADAISNGLMTGNLYSTTTLGTTALNIVPA